MLTFNIWRKSDLGKILIGHGNRVEKKLFTGDTLSDDWLLKSFNVTEYTDVIEAIGNANPNFARLLKSYRKIFRALLLSKLAVNSEVTNDDGDEDYIETSKFFKWCKQLDIPIDKEVKEGYKVFLQPAQPITSHIFPSYKHLSSYDEVIRVAISEFETVTEYPPTHAEEIIGRLKSKPPKDCIISFDTDAKSVTFKGSKRDVQWLRTRINNLGGFTKSNGTEHKPDEESAEPGD